jgi:hypothetical protein
MSATFPALGTDKVDSHSQGLDDVLRVTDHLFRFVSPQIVHRIRRYLRS